MMDERMSRLERLSVFHDDHDAGAELVRALERKGEDTTKRATAWAAAGDDPSWMRCATRLYRCQDVATAIGKAFVDTTVCDSLNYVGAREVSPFGYEWTLRTAPQFGGPWKSVKRANAMQWAYGSPAWKMKRENDTVTVLEVENIPNAVLIQAKVGRRSLTFMFHTHDWRDTEEQWWGSSGYIVSANGWGQISRGAEVSAVDDLMAARTLRRVFEILEEGQRGLRG